MNINTRIDNLLLVVNGGKGSGNFGHSGRKGLVGGSASKSSSVSTEKMFSSNMLHNYGGDNARLTGNIKDWFVTERVKKEIDKIDESIKTVGDAIQYIKDSGFETHIINDGYEGINWNEVENPSIVTQGKQIAATISLYKDMFGEDCMKYVKDVYFFSPIDTGGQGKTVVNLKDEKEKPGDGSHSLWLSPRANASEILHEFVHAMQATQAEKGKNEDILTWSKKAMDSIQYSGNDAYFGANAQHKSAEDMAEIVSHGIEAGGTRELDMISDLVNYVKKGDWIE